MKRVVSLLFAVFVFIAAGASSGGYPDKVSQGRDWSAVTDSVIDTLYYGRINSNGFEYDGRYFYFVNSLPEPAVMYRIDYMYGILDSFIMPNTGNIFGIGIQNGNFYISNWTNGTIEKLSGTGTSLATIASPGGTGTRGVTSDGKNLFIASTAGYIFVTDTLINIIDTIHISGIVGWPMDIAFCDADSTLWVIDDTADKVWNLNISVDPPVIIDSLPVLNGATNIGEGVAFDGNDLWVTTFNDTFAYRYDLGLAKTRVAYFEDYAPWGSDANEDILCRNGVAFHYFTSLDLPTVDFSKFQKAIFASQQENAFYTAITDNRSMLETWMNNGGIFQLNGATWDSYSWAGQIMPGGFSMVQQMIDTATIMSAWHPLLNEFYTADSTNLVNWGSVMHGRLTNLPADAYNVLLTGDSLNAGLSIFRMGKGGVIATTLTAEYAYDNAMSEIIENIDMYWVYGCSPNVLWAVADPSSPKMIKEIEEYPDFGNIDYMDARFFIPSKNDMAIYDIVLTYPDWDYADYILMGDSLFEHVKTGKWVITCGWSWYTTGSYLGGEIMNPSYNPFSPLDGTTHAANANLGSYVSGHEFMEDVSSLTSYYRDYLVLNSGADTVARWDDNEWLLGFRNLPGILGGVVGLNIVPNDDYVTSGWLSGDFAQLVHNVLLVSELTPVEEISKSGKPNSFRTDVTSITSGIFSASFSMALTEPVTLIIADKSGRTVSEKTFTGTTKEALFDAGKAGIASGVYFFLIKSGENEVKGKFLFISK